MYVLHKQSINSKQINAACIFQACDNFEVIYITLISKYLLRDIYD